VFSMMSFRRLFAGDACRDPRPLPPATPFGRICGRRSGLRPNRQARLPRDRTFHLRRFPCRRRQSGPLGYLSGPSLGGMGRFGVMQGL
jgi:hypothetical protein